MCWLIYRTPLRGNIQTNESFSGPGHASHKTNGFALFSSRIIDQLLNSIGRNTKILCPRIVTRDGINRMLCIQGAGSFNNRRCRVIRRFPPSASHRLNGP